MAARTTSLPDGPRMVAFRAAEEVLRADPALAATIKTWSTWKGEGDDRMPTASGMLPFLQMSPVMLPNESMGVDRKVAVLGVRIRVAVAGLIAEDIVNLWDAVEDALVKGRAFQETTVHCFLNSKHVFVAKLESPAINAWQSATNPPSTFLEGAGMLILRVSRSA
jgi:hypothetical protein